MNVWFALALVGFGAFFLLLALKPIYRVVGELTDSGLKLQWRLLGLLVGMFVVSYAAYGVDVFHHAPSLLVPFIFFFGGLFVVMVAFLAEKTAKDLKKISTLEQENITDPLMKIHNRRYFEGSLKEAVKRCYLQPACALSLLMIDVDYFKLLNDTHGHQKGDEVLVALAGLLQGLARKSDVVARYGGEEVCIIASGANEDEAVLLAERIREKVAQSTAGLCFGAKETACVTVSIGVATWREGESAGQLLKRADKALYQAKANGRNCVIHADACVG
jgi:diguanylate cyclase (GGDEF)-like protein